MENYLLELRSRLLKCLLLGGIILLVLLPFSNQIYSILAIPLLKQLPRTSELVSTNIAAPFVVPLKFATILALVLTMPYLFFQIWKFIVPALYLRERKKSWPLLISSIVLFYLGILFAYFLVFPLLFKFFVQTTPHGVLLLPDITNYLNMALQLFLAFGVSFQVPIIIILLIRLNIFSIDQIKQFRRYFIVLAFVIAMFIAPPDVFSQSSLAIPLCLLFEVGLWCGKK